MKVLGLLDSQNKFSWKYIVEGVTFLHGDVRVKRCGFFFGPDESCTLEKHYLTRDF